MTDKTTFKASLTLDKPLTREQIAYIQKFATTRRVRRKEKLTATRPDALRHAVNLPAGSQGAFFVGETGELGEDISFDVLNSNEAPSGQPDIWCPWSVDNDGHHLIVSVDNKNYLYIMDWLKYIIQHFIQPWGLLLNGEIEFQPLHSTNFQTISVKNNVIEAHKN